MLPSCDQVRVHVIEARKLIGGQLNAIVKIVCGGDIKDSAPKKGSNSPFWDQVRGGRRRRERGGGGGRGEEEEGEGRRRRERGGRGGRGEEEEGEGRRRRERGGGGGSGEEEGVGRRWEWGGGGGSGEEEEGVGRRRRERGGGGESGEEEGVGRRRREWGGGGSGEEVGVGGEEEEGEGRRCFTNIVTSLQMLYFHFKDRPQAVFDKVLEIKVLNAKVVLKNALIGSFKVSRDWGGRGGGWLACLSILPPPSFLPQLDVGTVYDEPEHCFIHKWLLLTDPNDPSAGAKVSYSTG